MDLKSIQEAKCFEFTVQIFPPPQGPPWEGGAKIRIFPPPGFIFLFTLAATALVAGSGYKAIEIRKFEFEAKI